MGGGDPKKKSSCCCCSKYTCIITFVNLFMLISGIVMAGLAAWGVKHHDRLADAVPPAGTRPLLVAGIFLCFLAVLGTFGVMCNRKKLGRCFLFTYSVILMVTMLLEVAAAAVLLQFIGKLDNKVVASLERDSINVWINETYHDCCFFPDGAPRQVYPCWTASHAAGVVNNATCSSEPLFRQALVSWLQDRLTPVAATGLVLFLLQFVLITSACCSLCQGRKQAKRRAGGDEDDDLRLLGVGGGAGGAGNAGSTGSAPQSIQLTVNVESSNTADEEEAKRRRRWKSRWGYKGDGQAGASSRRRTGSGLAEQEIDSDDSDGSVI